MGKARRHFWRLVMQRFREEKDGSLTPMTPPEALTFNDKQLNQKPKKGELFQVRKGYLGIVDSIVGRMREIRKTKKPYKLVKVIYWDVDSEGRQVDASDHR